MLKPSFLRFIHISLLCCLAIGFSIVLFLSVDISSSTSPKHIDFGVTFSRPYARDELGLDADAILRAALDDLKIRRFRLGTYWKFLQPTPENWNFGELDHDIQEISARQGKIVLAIGQKTPRWPECWAPDWWKKQDTQQQRQALFDYLTTLVTRYKNNSTIIAWQVENEPRFSWGDCGAVDTTLLHEEFALVRQLDPTRPIASTDSGELSWWRGFEKNVDMLGVSVYRVVQHPLIGTWHYSFLLPSFYRRKALLLSVFHIPLIYISEFQMEPWSNQPLLQTSLNEQFKTFSLSDMKKNIEYAKRMRLSPIDFWGLEWWYWMKEQGHPEFWEEAKKIFNT